MICLNCGTQLPEDANFCSKCGKPQRGGTRTESHKWELCEIKVKFYRGIFDSNFSFCAESIGPKGPYSISESKKFNINPDAARLSQKETVQLSLNKLMTLLIQDGWELLPEQGSSWYSYKFRRPTTK